MGLSKTIKAAANFMTPSSHLHREQTVLGELVSHLGEIDYQRFTPYFQWSPLDILVHLWFTDQAALHALDDPRQGDAMAAGLGAATRNKTGVALFAAMAAQQREILVQRHGHLTPAQIFALWQRTGSALCARFDLCAEDDTAPWFGRPLKIRRLIDARHMEVWCYGQDIFDLMGKHHPNGPGLVRVADFAVRNFRFAFANRGLAVPERQPLITLVDPTGTVHTWNHSDNEGAIRGAMVDFCLVATQRRHLLDTALAVSGDIATQWLHIAQCSSGPPLDGPAPGERAW